MRVSMCSAIRPMLKTQRTLVICQTCPRGTKTMLKFDQLHWPVQPDCASHSAKFGKVASFITDHSGLGEMVSWKSIPPTKDFQITKIFFEIC